MPDYFIVIRYYDIIFASLNLAMWLCDWGPSFAYKILSDLR